MKPFLFVAVAAALLAGLFLFFKPSHIAEEPRVAAAPPAPVQPPLEAPPTGTAANPVVAEFVVKAGKLASGDPTVKAREGDEVTLKITTDAADELHVHGYDVHGHLKAGETATIRIQATRSGRFPFELHKARLELGTLEVYPR